VDVWNKEEEDSVGHALVPVPTKRRDVVEFLPSWYSLMPMARVGLGVEMSGRVSGLGVRKRERGSGLKRREALRGEIKRGRMTLTYTKICRGSLPEEIIWPKERECVIGYNVWRYGGVCTVFLLSGSRRLRWSQ
jgi:hypothetical protein